MLFPFDQSLSLEYQLCKHKCNYLISKFNNKLVHKVYNSKGFNLLMFFAKYVRVLDKKENFDFTCVTLVLYRVLADFALTYFFAVSKKRLRSYIAVIELTFI